MNKKINPGRWEQMGADGVWTLLLSSALIIGTLGLSWLAMLRRVWRIAATTGTEVQPHDWIIVLGKRLLGATVPLDYATRLRRAEKLGTTHSRTRMMLLGGYTSEGPFSEAQQGKNFLQQRGIQEARIHVEAGSHHTLQNLHNARQLLGELQDYPLVLISSRYHLARCQVVAAGLGLPHELCAAEDRFEPGPVLIWQLCCEAFYLHWYWVGRLWSTWTHNKKSLARIS